MILGVISDTHDKLSRTQIAVRMLVDAGAEAIIHCGDFVEATVLAECAALPCWFVFGNNDSDTVPDLRRAAKQLGATCLGWSGVVEIAGKRIGVAHGHLTTDVRSILVQRPDYLLSGHSHVPSDERVDGIRRINPGALHRAFDYTVALLDLESDTLKWLRVPR
jgi:putative phosphoesterase